MKSRKQKIDWLCANVVGTIHSPAGFRAAGVAGVDVAEVRVDSLPAPVSAAEVSKVRVPVILTVRDPVEGGSLALGADERMALYHELLPAADAVDIEMRNLAIFRSVVEAAADRGIPVIASCHDFLGVPSTRTALRTATRARERGAVCVKFAATVNSPRELGALIALAEVIPRPFALMGMGRLGRVSRLALACCGSSLNYGWLAGPQVPGQWPAAGLKALIASAEG